jgi:hypothetical protein
VVSESKGIPGVAVGLVVMVCGREGKQRGLCLKDPLVVMPRYMADSLLRPRVKCCKDIWLDIEEYESEWINVEKLAHATPIDSLSSCCKLRIFLHKATIGDMGKNARQNLSLRLSKSHHSYFPTVCVYDHFTPSVR